MADIEIWTRRVAARRRSGLPAAEFCRDSDSRGLDVAMVREAPGLSGGLPTADSSTSVAMVKLEGRRDARVSLRWLIDLRWVFDRPAGLVSDRLGRVARGGGLFVFFFGKRTGPVPPLPATRPRRYRSWRRRPVSTRS